VECSIANSLRLCVSLRLYYRLPYSDWQGRLTRHSTQRFCFEPKREDNLLTRRRSAESSPLGSFGNSLFGRSASVDQSRSTEAVISLCCDFFLGLARH